MTEARGSRFKKRCRGLETTIEKTKHVHPHIMEPESPGKTVPVDKAIVESRSPGNMGHVHAESGSSKDAHKGSEVDYVPNKNGISVLQASLDYHPALHGSNHLTPAVLQFRETRKLSVDRADPRDRLLLEKHEFFHSQEAQHESRLVDYMGRQPEIKPSMRAILVDWLVEVAHKFELITESFYLTIYIIDRFLSMQVVPRRELQLVGVAAMLIACKYEEIWAPEVSDFIHIADNAYSRQQILGMEKGILNRMSWNLTVPTPYVFLVRFAKAARSDKELEHMVSFFAEMALMEYELVSLCPSLVAASAVYATRCTLKKIPLWTETLKHHTGFSELQLMSLPRPLSSRTPVLH